MIKHKPVAIYMDFTQTWVPGHSQHDLRCQMNSLAITNVKQLLARSISPKINRKYDFA